MLIFDILGKGFGDSLSMTFCEWFFTKNVFVLCYINWPNFIVWLLLLLDILGNMRTVLQLFVFQVETL